MKAMLSKEPGGPETLVLEEMEDPTPGKKQVLVRVHAAGVIIAESSLSFLGLGPQNIPTWGGLLSQGANYLLYAPHIAFFPGLFIMLTVLSLNLVGDTLRDVLDPRSEKRRPGTVR